MIVEHDIKCLDLISLVINCLWVQKMMVVLCGEERIQWFRRPLTAGAGAAVALAVVLSSTPSVPCWNAI